MIKISELVEDELAIASGRSEQVGFRAAISRQHGQLTHLLIASLGGITVAQAASAGKHLQGDVKHAGVKSVFESLVHVADFPKFVFDPASFDFFLECADRGG